MATPLRPDEVNAILGIRDDPRDIIGAAFVDAFATLLLYGAPPPKLFIEGVEVGTLAATPIFESDEEYIPPLGISPIYARDRLHGDLSDPTRVAQGAIAQVWACEHAALWGYRPVVTPKYWWSHHTR